MYNLKSIRLPGLTKPVGQPIRLPAFLGARMPSPHEAPVPDPALSTSPAPPTQRRSIIYVDGFNLYYGAIKDGPYLWLNLERFFVSLRQHDDIQAIHYFTALVIGSARVDQETYLKALSTLSLVNVILGKYKAKQLVCLVAGCTHAEHRHFQSWEEKRSDVNIAIQMLDDAYQDLCDIFVMVSGDSDLVPPPQRIRAQFPEKQIHLYVPTRDPVRGAAYELRAASHKDKNLPLDLLKHSQFPPQVKYGASEIVNKPASW